jgi:drug/metabolite transporter (DMT)-like permease
MAWLALSAVCILWGITYLGIRLALDAFGPFYLMAIRFLLSGAILLIGARLLGAHIPRGRNLWLTSALGIVTIGMGTGTLVVVEQWMPTGLAALFISMQPFWMVTVDWVLPRGHRPQAKTLRGLLIGLAGVAVLVAPAVLHEGWHGGVFLGFLLLQLGVIGWVVGALLQKRLHTEAHPVVIGAVQQVATGFFFLFPAMVWEPVPHAVGPRALGGLLYLVLFGSILGYSSFSYAMHKLPPAIVSIYTFVNPMVAVFLGWLLFREHFGHRELTAMSLIFIGVALVRRGTDKPAPALVTHAVKINN